MTEELLSGVNMPLDPDIRVYARLQDEYLTALSRHVSTSEEMDQAYDHPSQLPHELWALKLRYNQKGRELCTRYCPDWVLDAEAAVRRTEEAIRQIEGG